MTLVLWQRSYRHCDQFVRERGPSDHFTWTSEFGVMVFEWESPQRGAVQAGWSWFDTPLPRRFGQPNVLGFAVYRGTARHYILLPYAPLRGVSVPYWFFFVCTAALPWLWLKRWRRQRRAASRVSHGLCPRCGYDVRANADRCSECGLRLSSVIMAPEGEEQTAKTN